ncbi:MULTISPECIES: poly-beta-1,6-N-acetyl-D-glucosamine biosynthesis protein PgaD [Bacillaceae]|uniref:poly-beta-1,6-N-acetyl-D-glucosamine biosynthesis protein PgaD n=1 Tax=Bacillaceae TaxID=186817 RepID=UPI000BECDE4E|nr:MULTISPECIES: poly-beta-1,6-N-acetyl-D-glucosamine biosynthesis protein PgaD [unclassified Bacillus (in: firmicutes)]PEC50377.1 poly-beta-1,6-N-acetyl-D-glucosamine biosynthesis protein PgaD [Bacillus sp. AFS096315]PFM82091.1 poly-beta-1,6-N-acetyl-D-glucosamine biosynthesis protein PgaD [Bacillus sp. AFS077874]
MDKSRQGKQESGVIVHSKKNWLSEVMITITTLVVWIYCMIVIAFFITSLINYNNRYINIVKSYFKMTNHDIRFFILFVILLWIVFYFGLLGWKFYNLKRFGSLRRRSYPKFTTKEDLLNLKLMSEEDYNKLQDSKIIIFENNPIQELVNHNKNK